MRKLLLLLIITLASLNLTAQTTHAAYCEVVVHNAALFSQKVSAFVDAGTEKRGYIINEDGSKKSSTHQLTYLISSENLDGL